MFDLFKKYPYKKQGKGRNWIAVKELKEDSKYSLNFDDYKSIITLCTEVLLEDYIIQGKKVILPYALGDFELKKYKPTHWKKAGIDWKKTKENIANGDQRYEYYTLSHTEGYLFCTIWSKNKRCFIGQRFWRFHPHKAYRRKVSEAVLDNPLLITKLNLR